MRILHVTREGQSDQRYGLGKSLQPIVQALTLNGHTTTYLTRDDLNQSQKDNFQRWVKIIAGSFFSQSLKGVMRALVERIQMGYVSMALAVKDGYTHVHAHDPWIGLGVLFGKWRLKPQNLRWGITQHGFGSYAAATLEDGLTQSKSVHKALIYLEKWILSKASWVVSPTHLALQALAQDLSVTKIPQHWQVVPHSLPGLGQLSTPTNRSQLGWTDQDFVVLAVGRIVPLKQFDLLVRVCSSLSKKYPNLKLQILGDGDTAYLWTIAQNLEFADRLSVTSADNIEGYYASANIYVSTSRSESFGMANLEALGAGLPCVLSAAGGVSEVAGSGAWLIDCNQESLSAAIAALIESESLRKFWRQQALERVSGWPSIADVASKYETIYR